MRVQSMFAVALAIAPTFVVAQSAPSLPKFGAGFDGAVVPSGVPFNLSTTAAMRGAEVSVTGNGAGEIRAIRFGEWVAQVVSRSDGRITFLVPDAPAQAHSVTITLPRGDVTLTQRFTIQVRPEGTVGSRIYPACPEDSRPATDVRITKLVLSPRPNGHGHIMTIEGSGLGNYDAVHFAIRSASPERPDKDRFRGELSSLLGSGYSVILPDNAVTGPIGIAKRVGPGIWEACKTLGQVVQVPQ